MLWFVILLTALLVAIQLVVRLAPADPARWHQSIETPAEPGEVRSNGGVKRLTTPVAGSPTALLQSLDAIARVTPRTRILSGSVAEGRVTYETRSGFWGFPDYTTVEARGTDGAAQLAIHGRLRFGRSDFGVNRARVAGWLTALGQGG